MKIEQESISTCPICGSKLGSLGIAENYALQPLQAKVRIEYCACAACDFVMQSNPVVGPSLEKYYANSPRYRTTEVSDTEARLYSAQAAFMAASAPLRNRRVLDIGADMGKLLDHLQSEHGCETSYQEQNVAARVHLSDQGRHRDAGDLASAGQFDWIVLSQVLEHIVDPVTFLGGLRRNLVKDAALFIEVPNHSFWDDNDYGFSFEHVNYFSVASLTAALDRAGYVITQLLVCVEPRYFSGRVRIIRAAATAKSPRLLRSLPDLLREHNRRGMYGKFSAVEKLGAELRKGDQPGLALYGAGELAEQLFAYGLSADRVAVVFDSDARKHGRRFHEIDVRSPADIVSLNPAAIVILSGAEADIRRIIEATGYAGRVIAWNEVLPAD